MMKWSFKAMLFQWLALDVLSYLFEKFHKINWYILEWNFIFCFFISFIPCREILITSTYMSLLYLLFFQGHYVTALWNWQVLNSDGQFIVFHIYICSLLYDYDICLLSLSSAKVMWESSWNVCNYTLLKKLVKTTNLVVHNVDNHYIGQINK